MGTVTNLADSQQKLDAAVASRPTRRYRAAAFQAYVLFASLTFVILAIVARTVDYFPIDLTITRAVQSYHGVVFDRLMFGISWIGFSPQSMIFGLVPVFVLFAAGLRWEATVGLLAASSVAVTTVVKLIVQRPRPSIDLVNVISDLSQSGFPSGHVLAFTAFSGFLAFLAHTLLKRSWVRTVLITVFLVLALSMGVSRIYQGHHWFSDVMGAYLLGSLWLAFSIRVYRWGKPRFFVHQPVAPEDASGR